MPRSFVLASMESNAPSPARDCLAHRFGNAADGPDRVRCYGSDLTEAGGSPDPTAAIVDPQSLRAAANIPRSTSGWDGGKKAGGRKRHVVVNCLGLILAVAVTAASVQDRGTGRSDRRRPPHPALLKADDPDITNSIQNCGQSRLGQWSGSAVLC